MPRFYIDTAIWIDLHEDRKGYNGEPLGDYALRFLYHVLANGSQIVISDVLLRELAIRMSLGEIRSLLTPFENVIVKAALSDRQNEESKAVSLKRNVPRGDALHAILARDNGAVLITRDKHFLLLSDICDSFRPEELV